MKPCDYCDREESEVAACPSATATACSSRAFMGMLAAVQRVQKKLDACGNYVANTESEPTEVLFANGRTVKIVAGNLVIGWDKRRAATVFEGIAPPPDECCHAQNSHMEKR